MKRLYILMGGLIIATILMVVSILQWNTKVEMTTEKAKEDLTAIAEEDPYLAGSKTPISHSDPAHLEQQPTSSPNKKQDGVTIPNENVVDDSETKSEPNTAEDNETPKRNENNPTPSEGKTESQILSAYRDIFRDLEIQETSKADQLLVQAKADYVSGKLSKADLAVKYEEAALVLERHADQTFNTLYNQLEKDLKKYGHDPHAALDFRSEYNIKKQARLSRVINQLKDF